MTWDGREIERAMAEVAGIHEVLSMPWPLSGVREPSDHVGRFAADVLIPVDGDPAELIEVWRRGDEVLYAHPSLAVPERQDTVLIARWEYVHDVCTLEQFEARVWAIITREDRRG